MGYLSYEWLWRNGRLGNQLWQIASTAGIARMQGREPRFPTWEYQKFFNVPGEFFGELPARDRIDLGTDYLQELEFITNIEEDVRSWFDPTDVIDEHLAAAHPWFYDMEHFTAVHVRRGDYVNLPNHFPAPSLSYYLEAAKTVHDNNSNTTFLLFSDDADWCEGVLAPTVFGDVAHKVIRGVARPVEMRDRIGEPEDQYDLIMMSLCQEHIISNSTFAWWGAFLSDNDSVIYPDTWFGPALDNQRCPAPATWIGRPSC